MNRNMPLVTGLTLLFASLALLECGQGDSPGTGSATGSTSSSGAAGSATTTSATTSGPTTGGAGTAVTSGSGGSTGSGGSNSTGGSGGGSTGSAGAGTGGTSATGGGAGAGGSGNAGGAGTAGRGGGGAGGGSGGSGGSGGAPGTSLHFAVYGDTRTDFATHQQVVDAISKLNPQLVLHSGDLWDGYTTDMFRTILTKNANIGALLTAGLVVHIVLAAGLVSARRFAG